MGFGIGNEIGFGLAVLLNVGRGFSLATEISKPKGLPYSVI